MLSDSFEWCSTLVEEAISDLGITIFRDGVFRPCDGRLLFEVVASIFELSEIVEEHEDLIVTTLGDRTGSCDGFIGQTSHGIAVGLLQRVVSELPEGLGGAADTCADWTEISAETKSRFAEEEQRLNPRPEGWMELSKRVRAERLLMQNAHPARVTAKPRRDKMGAITEDDRKRVSAVIESQSKVAGMPTIKLICEKTRLGTDKVSQIIEERRAAGLECPPKRTRKQ